MSYVINEKGTLIKFDIEDDKSVVIPDNSIRIGRNLFKANNNLIEVTMPDSLKFVGDYVFNDTVLGYVLWQEMP